jgi:hypothetical protein
MDDLVDAGFVLLGGPVGAEEAALLLVEADDERAVRDRLLADPWARSEQLRVGLVESWLLWLGDSPARA